MVKRISFESLLNQFNQQTLGLPLHVTYFQQFYIRNQIFETLCEGCVNIEKEGQGTQLQDITVLRGMAREALVTGELAYKEVSWKKVMSWTKKIAKIWLLQARANLLNRQEDKRQMREELIEDWQTADIISPKSNLSFAVSELSETQD